MVPSSIANNPEMRPLSEADYASLESRWLTRELVDGCFLRRVHSIYGAEVVGHAGRAGDYAGILIPYVWPGSEDVVLHRIRRDHPELEQGSDGELKPRRKYLSPPGGSNRLYLVPQTQLTHLNDVNLPAVIVEGEFKTMALWRLSWHGLGDTADSPAFLPIGLQGVNNWRGTVGKAGDADGVRVDVRGPVSDLNRIAWKGRRVVIVFDADVEHNPKVAHARWALTRELEERGADVAWFGWPLSVPETQKGIDDYLAANGAEPVLRLLVRAKLVTRRKRPVTVAEAVRGTEDDHEWQADLICGDKGIKPILANAMTALRRASAWKGVMAFNEFSQRTEVRGGTPWRNGDYLWTDIDDIRLAEWLQLHRVEVNRDVAGQAIEAVAREYSYHPVRDYLDGLAWDRVPRIDKFLHTYFGVSDGAYSHAIGRKWLISAIARVKQPGCKVDHMLILEGVQGLGKSTALEVLGGTWFTDHIDNLGSKDSLVQMLGIWIIELGELCQLVSRLSELEAVKSFLVRKVDHFRPHYGRRTEDFPRQCVFSGSSNSEAYLRDETGGRRFWPVKGRFADILALRRDRDQIWAEARARFDLAEKWWIPREDVALLVAAEEEQSERFQLDPWDGPIFDYIVGARSAWVASGRPADAFYTTMQLILREGVKKQTEQWSRSDSVRVGAIMKHRGFEYKRERIYDELTGEPVLGPDGKPLREYRFRWPLPPSESAPSTQNQSLSLSRN